MFYKQKFTWFLAVLLIWSSSAFARDVESQDEEFIVEFYSIPSPDEILTYIHNSEIQFTPRLLNDVRKSDSYNTFRERLLAYGFYMANLAYSISFEQNNTGLQYFNTVDEMGRQLNIFPPEVEELGHRLMRNMNQMDSLNLIYDELYLLVIANLHDTDRFGEYALISAGGFVESLYLALNSDGSKIHDDGFRMRVWDQKLIINQLVIMFSRHLTASVKNSMMNDMQGLIDAFNEFTIETESTKVAGTSNGVITIGGGRATGSTVNSIRRIHEEVNKLREKWVN
ncbi:hypothetical protein EV194_1026 [Natronoflexus pectinivorans]|uniref:Uncharacterized protein n=2 Tax=Natronoflexus pectinivorans TaxID=682526 RepID=A0A4R2GLL3_9BACT|nr:hypothetical protein EV194_1026 [Natronoflexus pectinivorans]